MRAPRIQEVRVGSVLMKAHGDATGSQEIEVAMKNDQDPMERSNKISSSKYMIPQRKYGLAYNPTYPVRDVFSGLHRPNDVQDTSRSNGLHESTPQSLQAYKVRGVWVAKTQYDDESQGSPSSSGGIVPLKSGRFSSFKESCAEGSASGRMPIHRSQNRSCLQRSDTQSSSVSDCSSRAGIRKADDVISSEFPYGTRSHWSWTLVIGPDSCGNLDEPHPNVVGRASGVRGHSNLERKYNETRDPRFQNNGSRTIWGSNSRVSSHDFALRSGLWKSASTHGGVQEPSALPEFEKRQFWWKPSSHIVDPEPLSCPICMEVLDETDSSFSSCSCGFKLCLFCHHKIAAEDGRCPGCRKSYVRPKLNHEFKL